MSKRCPDTFTGLLVYMHGDLLFQEPIIYPTLLLISFHGDLKPISQATQHMYHCTSFKIMYMYWVPAKKYSMNAFLKTVKANQSYISIF